MNAPEIIAKAETLHRGGCNCAQAVLATLAPLYGFDEEQAKRLAAALGSGMAGMRLTCGAANAMCMAAGLHAGADGDAKGLAHAMAVDFEGRVGHLLCRDILAARKTDPVPKTRNCTDVVRTAVEIFLEHTQE